VGGRAGIGRGGGRGPSPPAPSSSPFPQPPVMTKRPPRHILAIVSSGPVSIHRVSAERVDPDLRRSYSCRAAISIGVSASASFQLVRNWLYESRLAAMFPAFAFVRARPTRPAE